VALKSASPASARLKAWMPRVAESSRSASSRTRPCQKALSATSRPVAGVEAAQFGQRGLGGGDIVRLERLLHQLGLVRDPVLEPTGLGQVGDVALLVGVEEDEAEGAVRPDLGEDRPGRSPAHRHRLGQAGAPDEGLGELRSVGLLLDRDEASPLRQRARHPEGGVPPEGPDLEHALRAGRAEEDLQEETGPRGNLDEGKAARLHLGPELDQKRVLTHEEVVGVRLQSVPGGPAAVPAAPVSTVPVGHPPSASAKRSIASSSRSSEVA